MPLKIFAMEGWSIVVDDENRENEGDFLTAAENVTPEVI